jgi:drug/metabolite transporter (DMT)-like permease
MIAIASGMTAAVAWSISALCASRSSRTIGAWSVVAWMMLVGLLAIVPLLVVAGAPHHLGDEADWFVIAGLGSVLGLTSEYIAMRTIPVSIAVAIAASEGVIAAFIGIAAGSQVTPTLLAGSSLVLVGVLMAGSASASVSHGPGAIRGYAWACLAAMLFGLALYATNQLAINESAAWAVLPPRALGVAVIAAPLALAGKLRVTRGVAPLVIAAGVAEVLGFLAVALGSRESLVVTDVLSSQFPAFTAIGAFLIFGERLGRRQRCGIALVAVGAGVIAGGHR